MSSNGSIALALGGGAARGWAHIGVLKALDEASVPISMIAGTSIGALVGGCYLAGKLGELETFARTVDRRRIFSLFDLRWGGSGLVTGSRIERTLIEILGDTQIDDLDRAFVAVACALPEGEEVWITSGSLVLAMRASYALPGIFEPVVCNGRTLIDGALASPVPVKACRTHTDDPVIAVGMSGDLYRRGVVIEQARVEPESSKAVDGGSRRETSAKAKPLGLTGVLTRSFFIIQDRISRVVLSGDPPDLALTPPVQHVGLLDFASAEEAIAIGYDYTSSQIEAIRDTMVGDRR